MVRKGRATHEVFSISTVVYAISRARHGRTGPLISPAALQTVMASPRISKHMDMFLVFIDSKNPLHVTNTDGQESLQSRNCYWVGFYNCVAAARSVYTIWACISRCSTSTRQALESTVVLAVSPVTKSIAI